MSYKIGELSKLTSCNIETLRYYEREGLLPPPPRGNNGYRYYPQDSVQRVRFILHAKSLGFSLADIAELLSIQVDKNASTCGDVKQIAEHKLATIARKISELKEMYRALEKVSAACDGSEASAEHCTILQALESDAARAEKHL
ncbi:MerR family Zn(II)-responsive transcriptional regulator of zntA [Litorivivens lipolytica]|uniref:MerR family Zn(II)-responsive transcriptional regulator of zntA n=1 Tax=Litorivivens lipolytica TaxID=1524264 RepID=A0A7W4W5N0_9GAMM|nr:Zn(2+)-responsive transcriptional regulator [Litorivivens lipolytica]MBB3047889.1 MerR family Zn(II)-responsive transcriptional regulator of zntA [Litorivivens lipolytica]